MRTRVAVPIVLAAMALGAAACGEDKTEKLPRAEFVSKATAVCADSRSKANAIPDPSGGRTDAEQFDRLAEYLGKATPIIQDGYERLRDLEPEDDALAKKWDGYLDGLQAAVGDLEQAQEHAKNANKAGLQAALKRVQDNDVGAESILGKGACAGGAAS